MPFGPTFCRAREHGCTTSTRRGAPNQKIIRSIATSSSVRVIACGRRRVFGDPEIVLRGLVVGLLRGQLTRAGIFRRRAGRSAGLSAAGQGYSGKQNDEREGCEAFGHGFLQ